MCLSVLAGSLTGFVIQCSTEGDCTLDISEPFQLHEQSINEWHDQHPKKVFTLVAAHLTATAPPMLCPTNMTGGCSSP